jgi:hypothetical protein
VAIAHASVTIEASVMLALTLAVSLRPAIAAARIDLVGVLREEERSRSARRPPPSAEMVEQRRGVWREMLNSLAEILSSASR